MFQEIIIFFQNTDPVLGALYATLFTWGLTAFGASFVFLFKTMNRVFLDGMLGFTGGVMVAASFWSLLAPGIEMSEGEGFVKVMPAAVGFGLGALFIFGLDKVLPHMHINFKEAEGIKTPWQRTTLLTLAITLHNIPEGLAVSVPIYYATKSKSKAFWISFASGLAEPLGAVIGFLIFRTVYNEALFGISFALCAGIMIYVALNELLPVAKEYGKPSDPIMGVTAGIIVMSISLILMYA